jgi:hypothetical protein
MRLRAPVQRDIGLAIPDMNSFSVVVAAANGVQPATLNSATAALAANT